MRRRLGSPTTEVAARRGVTQGVFRRSSTPKPGATELRILAAYVEAPGGRLEIIADFGDERLAVADPEARQPDRLLHHATRPLVDKAACHTCHSQLIVRARNTASWHA